MQSFKQYLKEDKEEERKIRNIVSEWRYKFKDKNKTFGKFSIRDGKINHLGRILQIFEFMLDENGELMIPFETCNSLSIEHDACDKITSFKNFPREIGSVFTPAFNAANSCKHITSWEGFPEKVHGNISLWGFSHIPLTNIDKFLKYCNAIIVRGDYNGPLLSLLKIEHLAKIATWPYTENAENFQKVINIIDSHVKDKNILKCQKELIQNGFKDYAKF